MDESALKSSGVSRRDVIAWLGRGFDFSDRQPLLPAAITLAKFIGALLVARGIELTGLLSPAVAREGELVTVVMILGFFPVLALLARRLNDTAMPTFLLFLAPVLYGVSSAAEVMFRAPVASDLIFWLAHACTALVAIGLCLPSRRAS